MRHFLIRPNPNRSYYFRSVVPVPLQRVLNRKCITVSLKNGILSESKKKARKMNVVIQDIYQQMIEDPEKSKSLTVKSIKNILINYMNSTLYFVEKSHPNYLISEDGIGKEFTSEIQGNIKITSVIETYLSELISRKFLKRTILDHERCLRLFINIVGDIPFDLLSYKVLRDYKFTIARLPPNIRTSKEYKKLKIDKILELNPKPISISTLNKRLNVVSQFFKWCQSHGYIDVNFAQGLQVKQDKSRMEQRLRFSIEDLRKLFDTYSYLNATESRDFKYWCPIIGALQGMRISEITAIHLTDIVTIDDLYCIDINENAPDKRLKNKSSKRIIPIHDTIIELDFIDYVDLLRKRGEERLFPELRYNELNGYIEQASQFFRLYKKALGFEKIKHTFHSFRHTFIDTGKQLKINREYIAEAVGHHVSGVTFGRYGKEYIPKVLYDEVFKKINYDINWKSLKKNWKQ